MSILNPYLSFQDNARDAMDFYRSVFGGELTRMTFGEMSMPGIGEADAALVMHSQLTTTAGFTLMGADTPSHMGTPVPNGQVSLSGEDEAELRGYWDKLVVGGTPGVPLEKAPWGDYFGMCTDRFGVPWLVNITDSSAEVSR